MAFDLIKRDTWVGLKLEERREKLEELQNKLLEMEKEIPESSVDKEPTANHFAKGLYGRELFLPKGTCIVGKVHKQSSLQVLLEGKLIMVTDRDHIELEAPQVLVSPPLTKRAAYVLEDVRWLTVLGTDLEEVGDIENKLVANTYEEVKLLEEKE